MAAKNKTKPSNFSRSISASKYYSHGSYAAKLEEARDEVSLKYYGRQVKQEERINRYGSIKKILCACIFCLCAITTVYARSAVSNYQLENKRLKLLLEDERYNTETILAASTEKIDINYVEEVATQRLNMAKPQPYQIAYIEVPKTDYTVLHGSLIVEEKEKLSFKDFTSFETIKSMLFPEEL